MKQLPPFRSARTKHARAAELFEELQREIKEFKESRPYRITNECDHTTGEKMAVYYSTADFPEKWSAIIGEILFNLRCALDHAVYELTVIENGTPLEMTEFPIFSDKARFLQTDKDGNPTRKSGLWRIRGLPKKAIDSIEFVQPFNELERHPSRIPYLAVLQAMNNIDKHREIHLCRRLRTKTNLRVVREIEYAGESKGLISRFVFEIGAGLLGDRAVLVRWKPVRLDDEMDIDADVPFEIVFDEESTPGYRFAQPAVTAVLGPLIAYIADGLGYLAETAIDDPEE